MGRHLESCLLTACAVLSAATLSSAQCSFDERLKILPSDGAQGDTYGSAIAADGDVVVVGSPLADGTHANSGAAYVYRRTAGVWSEDAVLAHEDPQAFDDYGISVDVEGDVIVVGAFFDDGIELDDGSAFVYRYDGSTWQQEQKLTASDPAFGDRFGRSVVIEGNWIAVSAYRSDDLGADSGSVYLFEFDGATWVEKQRVFASDGAAGDLFGVDVAMSADTLLVGSYFDDTTQIDAGSGYVFRYDGANWIEEQKLVALDAEAEDQLGATVSIDGNTAVLGSYGDNVAGDNSGSVYVYEFIGGAWVFIEELVASDASPADEFGWSVSLKGKVLAVGAYRDNHTVHEGGAAYIYRRLGHNWIEETKLEASDVEAKDWFASAVSIAGDDLWIGAMKTDDDGTDSGSAYLFDIRSLGLDADPLSVAAGQTLTLSTAAGAPGSLAALFVVGVGATPVFYTVTTMPFDGDCTMDVPIVIPPGFAGIEASFQSYGYIATGKLTSSNVVTVSLL